VIGNMLDPQDVHQTVDTGAAFPFRHIRAHSPMPATSPFISRLWQPAGIRTASPVRTRHTSFTRPSTRDLDFHRDSSWIRAHRAHVAPRS
jgi:hypothetical protein